MKFSLKIGLLFFFARLQSDENEKLRNNRGVLEDFKSKQERKTRKRKKKKEEKEKEKQIFFPN